MRPGFNSPSGKIFRTLRERWRQEIAFFLFFSPSSVGSQKRVEEEAGPAGTTGCHWGPEHLERREGDRAKLQQRVCPHCAQRGRPGLAEDTLHIIYDCALYNDLRPLFPELFPAGQTPGERPTLAECLALPSAPLAEYAGAARRRARSARGMPP